MKKPIFRPSTLMILILDAAILLAIWHSFPASFIVDSLARNLTVLLVAIILMFFTMMVALGFRGE